MNSKDSDLLWVGGLGLAYLYFSKPASAAPRTYPTNPIPGTQPRPPQPIGGGSTASGGGLPVTGGPPMNTPIRPTYPTTDPNTGIVDSGDMCDPNSIYYDPVTCASYTGTDQNPDYGPAYNPNDTFDPCDPNSVSFDPSQCGYVPYTQYGGDSFDPCDPNSVNYNPVQCGYMTQPQVDTNYDPYYEPFGNEYWGGSSDYIDYGSSY